VLVVLLASGHAAASPPARYALTEGDWLTYEWRAESTRRDAASPSGRVESRATIQLWCLGREGDEWLMLGLVTRQIDDVNLVPRGLCFYVNERGVKRLPEEFLARAGDLDPVLDLFPECRPALLSSPTWTTTADMFGRRWVCTPPDAAGDDPAVSFRLEDTSGVSAALGAAVRGKYVFDRVRGVLRESRQTIETPRDTTAVSVRLLRRNSVPAAWRLRRIAELDSFRRTLRMEDRYLASLEREPERAEATLARLDAIWIELLGEFAATGALDNPAGGVAVPRSPLMEMARGQREALDSRRGLLRERARLASEWNGRRAPQWSLLDRDGQTVTSESTRDRPSLECFWRSDDLGSLRMMQTLGRLREQFPQDALRIVCINMDQESQAARRAADLCAGDLLHVFAGPPVGADLPTELPVCRLVAEDGRIVRVFVGWRHSLVGELAGFVR
jgi:hypothetical protein